MGKALEYKTKVVTYFDILGFKQMIKNESAEEIKRILRVFRESSQADKPEETEFVRGYTNFSDLNVRSILISSSDYLKVRPPLLDYEIESIARIQCKLIEEEAIVVAGGMAVGGLVEDGDFIFGQGLVDAYELEKIAKFPRILVSPELANIADYNAEATGHSFASQLIARGDDALYVDYLRAAVIDKDDNEILAFLQSHADLIERCLREHIADDRVRPKYEWLRVYHNKFVRERFPIEDLEVPEP